MATRRHTGVLSLALIGCTPSEPSGTDTGQAPQPAGQVSDWCQAVAGGPGGTRTAPQDFARARVGHRVFGPTGTWLDADETPVYTLRAYALGSSTLLSSCGAAFDDVCDAEAQEPQQGPATLEVWGSRA